MNAEVVAVTGPEKAELITVRIDDELGANEVRGRTLVSLVSPGTELAANYKGGYGKYPTKPGYAAVFRADEIGSAVDSIAPGDVLFCSGGHRSLQQCAAVDAVPVPDGLPPSTAVVARLMGVTMTTLMTTDARPGDPVLVTGVGPVGYLGAHCFRHSGYDVHVLDPAPGRREQAERTGLKTLASTDDPQAEFLKGRVALVVECSGHEQAVLDGAGLVRKRGEVVLVGVPWQRRTDRFAHELLHAVFHNYVVLRSGWEWELPRQSAEFRPHSIHSSYGLALQWLKAGAIPVDDLVVMHRPEDAQSVYQDLLHGRASGLFQVFDWAGDA